MKKTTASVCVWFFILYQFLVKCYCLQTGLEILFFQKTDAGIEFFESQVNFTVSEQEWVSSSAQCATSCAESDWCRGYFICKHSHKSLCSFLKINNQMSEDYSDYLACLFYLPSDFQLPKKTKTKTVTTTTPTTTITPMTTTALSLSVQTYTTPSYCNNEAFKPSTSNGCQYGLKPGCKDYYKDCQESYSLDHHEDKAVYLIKPDGFSEPFKVLCNGGSSLIPRFTYIQRNMYSCCPYTSFNQSWAAYRDGFGDLETFSCSFWLGNQKIVALAKQGQYKLGLYGKSSSLKISVYNNFLMMNENSNFKMKYDSYNDIGLDDVFKSPNVLNPFYTFDHDSDAHCAVLLGSGWWFDDNCEHKNPNVNHDAQLMVNDKLKTFEDTYMLLL